MPNSTLKALNTLQYIPFDELDKIPDRLDFNVGLRGGSLYNNISDPKTGNRYSINSKKGKKILKSYIKYNKLSLTL